MTGSPIAGESELGSKTVQELQALAAEEAARPVKTSAFSRAAYLHLIDLLSRRAGTALALISGLTIFITVLVARATPLRAGVWTVIVFASLFACRSYLTGFRRGDHITAHPFRWRAYHTSAITVLSFAFGAGAVLLLARDAAPFDAYEILGLLLVGALGAAALSVAHLRSALAACLPAFAFILIGAWRQFGMSAKTAALALALAGAVAALTFAATHMRARALQLHPRTLSGRSRLDQLAPRAARPAKATAASALFG